MIATWEQAAPSDWPIVWYQCYDSSLAIFKTRQKAVKQKDTDMLSGLDDVVSAEDVPTGERRYYRMRLPYTNIMIERYNQRITDNSI